MCKDSESVERYVYGAIMCILFVAYAVVISSIMNGFGAGAFIIWAVLVMLTAIFYVLLMIRNALYRMSIKPSRRRR